MQLFMERFDNPFTLYMRYVRGEGWEAIIAWECWEVRPWAPEDIRAMVNKRRASVCSPAQVRRILIRPESLDTRKLASSVSLRPQVQKVVGRLASLAKTHAGLLQIHGGESAYPAFEHVGSVAVEDPDDWGAVAVDLVCRAMELGSVGDYGALLRRW